MINKCESGNAMAKKIGTGAGSTAGIKSYTRSAKSFKSR